MYSTLNDLSLNDVKYGLCDAIRFIVAANLRFAVKIQDIGKPEARRHEIRSKAYKRRSEPALIEFQTPQR